MQKLQALSTRLWLTDRWSIDVQSLPLCFTSVALVKDYTNGSSNDLAKCLSTDGIGAPSIDTLFLVCIHRWRHPRQSWPQNARVILKGSRLVLGESYPDVSIIYQLKHILDTLPPIFMNFPLLKDSQLS